MFKKLFILFAALVIAFCAYVAMQPSQMRVARSTEIAAPADVIFPHINNLKKFDAWSPWSKLDPNATMTYDGSEEGEGATATWKGNQEVGEGTMTIIESSPSDTVKLWLEFVEPWPGSANVEFLLEPAGANTKVTWAMESSHGFFERAMCTLLRMKPEDMIGEKYQEGLANLKKTVEAGLSTG